VDALFARAPWEALSPAAAGLGPLDQIGAVYYTYIGVYRRRFRLMSSIIHARLDAETERRLLELRRRLGWNDSQVVRAGIKSLSRLLGRGRSRAIVGLGRFRSGVPDLGSNKDHLKGFGR
jgi:hypothetical protein